MRCRAVWAVLTLIVACAPRAPELSDPHAAAIRDSVETTLAALLRYGATGQWDSLGGLYADDPAFLFAEDGAVRYRSAREIREALAMLPPGTRLQTTHEGTAIMPLAPGVASAITRFHTSFVDSTGTAVFSFSGIASLLLVHRAAGWQILAGHSSSSVPRAGP